MNHRALPEAFVEWFDASQVVTPEGRPRVVFHGTDADFDRFDLTDDIGFHFGSAEAANARIEQARMEGAQVLPVYLAINRPLRLPDLHTWSSRGVAAHLARAGVITEDEADETELVDREQVLEWLSAKGFDGIVYANESEGGGDSYIALRPEQIKSVFNRRFHRDSASLTDFAADPELERAARETLADAAGEAGDETSEASRERPRERMCT